MVADLVRHGPEQEALGAGDIVDVRFAQTRDPRATAYADAARVTKVVERKDSALASDFERRLLSRSEPAATQSK